MAQALAGKVAVVTGGASGIGNAIARRFLAEGASVALFDIAKAQVAGDDLGAQLALTIDVASAAEWEAGLAQVVSRLGGIDILVNNAAISGPLDTPVGEYPPDGFERVIGVNLLGPFLGMRYAIPHMLAGGGGAIVNISAAAAVKTTPGVCAYNASKAGVDSLTRTAAYEYAARGIRINSIRPGMVETPMLTGALELTPEVKELIWSSHPMQRVAMPTELAAAAVFLASDEASYITGAHLSVDGGYLAS